MQGNYKRSSLAADQPTRSGVDGPTLHDAKQQQVTDSVAIGELTVSEELLKALEQAIRHPNFVTITYIGSDGKVHPWWQTRNFPNQALDPSLDFIRKDMRAKIPGLSPVSQGFRDELAKLKKKPPGR